MCVVSMIYDHYYDKWKPIQPVGVPYVFPIYPPTPTAEEISEFRKLLARAREYDKRNNEPECELEEKKAALKKIADAMGVDISFINDPKEV